MVESVTLELLSNQCDRLVDEIQATHKDLHDAREVMRRCEATAEKILELIEECRSVLKARECD